MTNPKALAVIRRNGKSDVSREDSRDVNMRLVQLIQHGTSIEAGLIAHNGAGSVEIESGIRQETVYLLVGPDTDGTLYDRVKLLVNGVYLSVAQIAAMHDEARS